MDGESTLGVEQTLDSVAKKRLPWKSRNRNESGLAWLLVIPSLILIFGLTIYPVLYSFWLSLHAKTLLNPISTFVGFKNYITILSTPEFWSSLGRTAYFVVISLLVQTVLGLAIAVVLNKEFIGRKFVRALILLPWAIPNIVNGVMWQWIYNSDFGALNHLLMQLGIIKENVHWLSTPFLALNMVIVADTWKIIPFYVILFLAGMQTIPNELYEAARIDGANRWKGYLHITLPMLKPILLVILVLRTMQCFGVFDIIYIMTKGGPADGTMVVSFLTYFKTFGNLDFGMGSAISFLVAAMILVISLVYIRLLRTDDSSL